MADKPTQADVKTAQSLEKVLLKVTDSVDKLTKATKGYGKENKKVMKAGVKDLDDVNDNLHGMEKEVLSLQGSIKKVSMKGFLKKEEAVKYNNELKGIEKEILRLHKMSGKGGGPLSGAALTTQKKLIGDLQKKLTGARGNIKNLAASSVDWDEKLSKVGPAFLKNWAAGRKSAKAAGKQVAKMPGLFKAAGAAAKKMSGVMGGITKIITGWPGLIFGALKMVVDMGMAADQFVKDANKAFAYLRGPDIMTGDVKGQFKEFNDLIYQAGENIRVGLDVTQIRELMLAARDAGANITNLNKGLLTYRDAIYVASKASKTLGLELPMVGSLMGKMMVDMRMDLDQMNEAFVQIAFDAKKSGLSTDRFWTTVQNASSSLALYGVVVKQASQTVAAFTENMVGGADDAAEATDNMYEVFKSGGLKAQMALIDFAKAGGADVPKIFGEMAEEAAGRVEAIEGEINIIEAKGKKKSTEDVDQLKKLRSEMYAEQSKTNRFLKVQNGTTAMHASEAGALAKRAPEMIIAAITGQVGQLHKLSGDSLLVAIQSGKVLNQSEKTIRMLVEIAKITEARMTDLAARSATFFNLSEKGDKDTREKIANAIIDTAKATGDDQIEASEILRTVLEDTLGMSPGMASDMAKLVRNDDASSKEMAEILKKGDADMAAQMSKIISSDAATQAMAGAHFKDQEKTEADMADAADDTFKGIVEQTLSYNEMVKIAKDEVLWRLSSFKMMSMVNSGVWNILKHMIGDKPFLTNEQKMARKNLELQNINIKENKNGTMLLSDIALKVKEGTAKAGLMNVQLKEQNKLVSLLTKAKEGKNVGRVLSTGLTDLNTRIKDLTGKKARSPLEEEQLKVAKESKGKLEEFLAQNAPLLMMQKEMLSGIKAGTLGTKIPKFQKSVDELKAGIAKQLGVVKAFGSEGGPGGQVSAEKRGEMDKLTKMRATLAGKEKILAKAKGAKGKKGKDLETIVFEEKAIMDKMNQEIKGSLPGMLDQAKITATGTLNQLTEQKAINTNLVTLNKEASIASEIQKQMLLSTEGGQKRVRDILKGKETPEEIYGAVSAMGLTEDDLKQVMQGGVDLAQGAVEKAAAEKEKRRVSFATSLQFGKTKQQPQTEGAVPDFFDIIKGGFVNVKSGDILIDKSSFAQGTGGPPGTAMPAVAAAAGATGGKGAPGGTTINIKVDATEKDLAGRIANQIKKELYNRAISTSSYSLN